MGSISVSFGSVINVILDTFDFNQSTAFIGFLFVIVGSVCGSIYYMTKLIDKKRQCKYLSSFIGMSIIIYFTIMVILITKAGTYTLGVVSFLLGFFMFTIEPVIFELIARNIKEVDYNFTNSVFYLIS